MLRRPQRGSPMALGPFYLRLPGPTLPAHGPAAAAPKRVPLRRVTLSAKSYRPRGPEHFSRGRRALYFANVRLIRVTTLSHWRFSAAG